MPRRVRVAPAGPSSYARSEPRLAGIGCALGVGDHGAGALPTDAFKIVGRAKVLVLAHHGALVLPAEDGDPGVVREEAGWPAFGPEWQPRSASANGATHVSQERAILFSCLP